jgi:hypothetical protein
MDSYHLETHHPKSLLTFKHLHLHAAQQVLDEDQ